jgi:catechol 2,3-dioxygenase
MPADATLTRLDLRVHDRDAVLPFYRDLLGLPVTAAQDGIVLLGPAGGALTLTLQIDPGAPLRPGRSVGLYHFALLLPERAALGAVLRRLLDAGWPLDGAGDHGVSEALYLRDPEGNGIELYRDRVRAQWPRAGDAVLMGTDPVDIDGLLADAPAAAPLHPATRLGHIHLSVDDLGAGESFYAGTLGLNVTLRGVPGALFLAAGDYHHHIGLNTWGSRRRAPPAATGLVGYTWRLPAGGLSALRPHLSARAAALESAPGTLTLTDPFGIRVTLQGD